MYENEEKIEKVILVAVDTDETDVETSLDELAELAKTAGAEVVGRMIQKLPYPNASTYIGSGKIDELIQEIHWSEATGIITDDELSPAQMKNLEDVLDIKIMDRTMLILDIFAKHASTSEGKLQVEMAQLKYRSARLVGMRKSMSRVSYGIGMRGPGEKKLEVDRRLIRDRISKLREEIENVEKNRSTNRVKRQKNGSVVAAIVGYTNAGKSTLLNKLTGADILAADMLFATLDPTVRMLELNDGQEILLTDTVGFIRKLPHGLVESFKSTLDEVSEADLLLHVVDISHPDYEQQIDSVNRTLDEIGAADKPTIMVFNKVDAYTFEKKDEDDLTPMTKKNWTLEMLQNSWLAKENAQPTVFISAAKRENIDSLRTMMYDEIKRIHAVRYPYNNFLW